MPQDTKSSPPRGFDIEIVDEPTVRGALRAALIKMIGQVVSLKVLVLIAATVLLLRGITITWEWVALAIAVLGVRTAQYHFANGGMGYGGGMPLDMYSYQRPGADDAD